MNTPKVRLKEPDHNVSPEKKRQKPWLLTSAKWMYSEYKDGKSLYGLSDVARINENRRYAAGKEDSSKFKPLLKGDNKGVENRKLQAKMFENLDWGRMSFLPKFVAIAVNKYLQINHKVDITAIDKDAAHYRLKKEVEMRLREGLSLNPEGEIPVLRPSASQERSIAHKLGGFKIEGEIVHKKLNKAIFDQSNWYETKRKLIQDFVENAIMCSKDYTCKSTGKVKIRYVNIAKFCSSHNRAKGSNSSEYFFEIVPYSITDLMQEDEFKNYKREDWDKILKSNGSTFDGSNNNYRFDQNWMDDYGSVTIDVMDFEQVTVDKNYITIKSKEGKKKVYNEKGKDYGKVRKTPLRKTEVETFKNVYRGKWLIGSDAIFDTGQQYDIPRPSASEIKPSFHVYRSYKPSLVEMCKGSIDSIRLYQLRLQNLVANADDPGLAIEYNSLQGMKLAGSKAKPLEVLRLKRSTGDLVFTTHNNSGAFSDNRYGGSGIPIKELQGGIGSFGQELLSLISSELDTIRNLTGLNEIVDGSSPNPEVTARQAGLAAQSSNNALNEIYDAYKWVKKETAENCALRVQLAVTSSQQSYDAYYPIADGSGMEYLELTKDMTLKQLGVTVKVMPTEEMIAKFEERAGRAVETGAIDMVEYHLLSELAQDGRIEEALVMMDHRKAEKLRMENEQKERMIAIQGKENKELEEMKSVKEQQRDQRLLEMKQQEVDLEIKKQTALSDIEVREYRRKKMIDQMADARVEESSVG